MLVSFPEVVDVIVDTLQGVFTQGVWSTGSESTLTKDYLGHRPSKIWPLRRVSDPEGNDLTSQKQGLRWQQKQQDLMNVAIRVRLITSTAPRCVTRTQTGWNTGTEEGQFWAIAFEYETCWCVDVVNGSVDTHKPG